MDEEIEEARRGVWGIVIRVLLTSWQERREILVKTREIKEEVYGIGRKMIVKGSFKETAHGRIKYCKIVKRG